MRDRKHTTGWACSDCLMLMANGEAPDHMDAVETTLFLESFERHTEAYDVSLGLVAEEHDAECRNVDHEAGEWLGGNDCECETQTFSWKFCDTCGSTLGGFRHAVTFWTR